MVNLMEARLPPNDEPQLLVTLAPSPLLVASSRSAITSAVDKRVEGELRSTATWWLRSEARSLALVAQVANNTTHCANSQSSSLDVS